jgi:hypothetical protein
MPNRELWNVEFDPTTGLYSIEFDDRFSIHRTEFDIILDFINWRLEKLQKANQSDSAIQNFKAKYHISQNIN